jgi:hypothetical protein
MEGKITTNGVVVYWIERCQVQVWVVLARNHFCGENPNNMPLALVIFGDNSHLDLHGSLSTLPLTSTLSCFNQRSRNKSEFWRPLSFIPNLSYGSSSSKNSSNPHASVQDEHDCLRVSLSLLMDIHKHGGISATVMGRPVILKVWIHFLLETRLETIVG